MPDKRLITAAVALREALDLCLERDPSVYVMGEGIADPKGIFGTTAGLVDKYGTERVIEMPIAENGLTAIAIGSAMMGMRPVMVHQRADFALLAVEQLFDNAAKSHYVSRGAHKVPLVVRMIIGRGWGQGPAHSQSLENLFAAVPGLKVVMPTSAADCKGMLIAAIEDDNPVLFLEHRWFHNVTEDVPAGYYTRPLDGPRVVVEGSDVTIVATSYMVYEARRAALMLREIGVSAEVFDLRVLRPLKLDAIAESVRRTGRLITVDTGFRTLNMGAEVVAEMSEAAFGAFKAAPQRLGLPEHPTPSSRSLADRYYVNSRHIIEAVARSLGLSEAKVAPVLAKLDEELARFPVDVPDPAFRGPF